MVCYAWLSALKMFFIFGFQQFAYVVLTCGFFIYLFFTLSCLGLMCFFNLQVDIFSQLKKKQAQHYLFICPYIFFPFWGSNDAYVLDCLVLFHRSLNLGYLLIFFYLFSLCIDFNFPIFKMTDNIFYNVLFSVKPIPSFNYLFIFHFGFIEVFSSRIFI